MFALVHTRTISVLKTRRGPYLYEFGVNWTAPLKGKHASSNVKSSGLKVKSIIFRCKNIPRASESAGAFNFMICGVLDAQHAPSAAAAI